MKQLIAIGLVFVLLLATGCSNGALNLDSKADGKSYTATVGDIITITLESNPSTGYSWETLDELPEIFEQEGEPVYTPVKTAKGIVGAGGTLALKFRVVEAGTAKLTLGYQRSFEDNPPVKTFSVDVTAHT